MGFFIAFDPMARHTPSMPLAWNAWYHVTIHVYGSWLRGDPRGWRARHHREHVEGDYRNPPPTGMYDPLYQRSQSLMKRDPVRIASDLRQFTLNAIVDKLQQDGIEVSIASLDASHLHVLARFPDHNPRHWTGRAKKHASHMLRQSGMRTESGGLWAKRSHPNPISDAAHHRNVRSYINRHKSKGASVYDSVTAENNDLATAIDDLIESIDELSKSGYEKE